MICAAYRVNQVDDQQKFRQKIHYLFFLSFLVDDNVSRCADDVCFDVERFLYY